MTKQSDTEAIAYRIGQLARQGGAGEDQNPYSDYTLRAWWAEGWQEGGE